MFGVANKHIQPTPTPPQSSVLVPHITTQHIPADLYPYHVFVFEWDPQRQRQVMWIQLATKLRPHKPSSLTHLQNWPQTLTQSSSSVSPRSIKPTTMAYDPLLTTHYPPPRPLLNWTAKCQTKVVTTVRVHKKAFFRAVLLDVDRNIELFCNTVCYKKPVQWEGVLLVKQWPMYWYNEITAIKTERLSAVTFIFKPIARYYEVIFDQ